MKRSLVLIGLGLLIAGCPPGLPTESSFDDQNNLAHERDNYVACGTFVDENGEIDQLLNQGGVLHLETSSLFTLQADFLTSSAGTDFYSFCTTLQELPVALVPGGVSNFLQLGYFGAVPFAETEVRMHPNVMVVPVYTWNFISAQDGQGVDLDETGHKFIYDRAPLTVVPPSYAAKYWPTERVDEIWSQCQIQFRHMAHFEVMVPHCYSSAVFSAETTGGQCFHGSSSHPCLSSDAALDCANECTVSEYIRLTKNEPGMMDLEIAGGINIYILRSFQLDAKNNHLAIACGNRIYVDDAKRASAQSQTMGRLIAHEIGHVLGEAGHPPNTLMQIGASCCDFIPVQMCLDSRIAATAILSQGGPSPSSK